MSYFTLQEVVNRSGLSEHTLRYYEQISLLDKVDRDSSSGHRRYTEEDLHIIEALACLRATGMSIEDMRRQTADFMLEMAGVAKCFTYQDLMDVYGKTQNPIVQAFHPKRSGDVIVELEPGWAEELDNVTIVSRPPQNRLLLPRQPVAC